MDADRYEGIEFPDAPFNIKKHTVLMARRGSEAHGLYIPPTDPDSIDDRDVIAIVMPPVKYYLGLSKWEGAESIKGVWDVVAYEYRKLVSLLIKQNPNVLSLLYTAPEDYLYIDHVGQALLDNRELFKARIPAFEAFQGYAYSQLKKMTSGVFEGYMGAKRKQLVERYGYDTKTRPI